MVVLPDLLELEVIMYFASGTMGTPIDQPVGDGSPENVAAASIGCTP